MLCNLQKDSDYSVRLQVRFLLRCQRGMCLHVSSVCAVAGVETVVLATELVCVCRRGLGARRVCVLSVILSLDWC